MERRKEEPRVVADTNILISALLKGRANSCLGFTALLSYLV